jgi:hypothetical protein
VLTFLTFLYAGKGKLLREGDRLKNSPTVTQIKHPTDKLCHGMLLGLSFALTRSLPSFTISFLPSAH